MSPEVAEGIWDRMITFGRYGFSIIHAVEYALITYACMFLKHYYPMEWWASILTNASEQEITGSFWPYVKDMVFHQISIYLATSWSWIMQMKKFDLN